MLSTTHLLFSGSIAALAFNDPELAAVGAIAGLLPDVDTPRSLPGRLLFPITAIVSKWGHRQVTHSLMGSIIVAGFTLPLVFGGVKWWLAVQLGYGCGWLLDAASKSGVPVLYPSPKRLVFPFDPNFRIATGSPTERLIQGLLVAIAIAVLQTVGDGGVMAGVRSMIASDQGAIAMYREFGGSRELVAQVEGFDLVENRPISGQFRIVGADGPALILQDAEGKRYALGKQIEAKRIEVEKGAKRAIAVRPVSIADFVAIADLLDLVGDGTVTGTLETDDEPPVLTQDARQFAPIAIAGQTITLTAATREDLERLGDIWIKGSVSIRG